MQSRLAPLLPWRRRAASVDDGGLVTSARPAVATHVAPTEVRARQRSGTTERETDQIPARPPTWPPRPSATPLPAGSMPAVKRLQLRDQRTGHFRTIAVQHPGVVGVEQRVFDARETGAHPAPDHDRLPWITQ